jgi:hypothetical protein
MKGTKSLLSVSFSCAVTLSLFVIASFCPAVAEVECKAYPIVGQTGTEWPLRGHDMMYCGTTNPAAADGLLNEVVNSAQMTNNYPYLQHKFESDHVQLWVFTELKDFNEYFGNIITAPYGELLLPNATDSDGLTPLSSELAWTNPFSALFEEWPNGDAATVSTVYESTNHEMGNLLDAIDGNVSQLAAYTTPLKKDIATFNALGTQVTWQLLPASCKSQSTNWAKLLCWDGINKDATGSEAYNEDRDFFAEEFAALCPSGTNVNSIAAYILTYFPVSKAFVYGLMQGTVAP